MTWTPPDTAFLCGSQAHIAKEFAVHSVVHFVVPTQALANKVAGLGSHRILPFVFAGGGLQLAQLQALWGAMVLHQSLVGHPDYAALCGISRAANAGIERARARLFGERKRGVGAI